ncbi:hypothetical protein [Granulicella sp. S190]|uniref:VHL beta domain-containing protein n=1 Tax=Granulicella sp. S190 TaxID=1747226 RepID=UPI00131DC7B7|nr:hypothetical protein [Granulicella sp. S190]
MTASMDVAKQNLRQRGVELHIVGRGQELSILPENLSVRGSSKVSGLPQKSDTDGSRAQSGIYSACGEESLLATASDAGKNSTDLCMREFAIALMNYGFDDEIRRLIESQYHSSVAAGHWNGTRAAASPEDYWAELSMWYFDIRASFAAQGRSAESAANAIRAEDPSGFALVDLLYTQKKRPVAIEAIRARAVSKLALSSVSKRPAELQLVNNSGKNIRFFWIDTEGELRPIGELGPYNRTIEKTFFQHVWMIEDQRGVEIQRFVIEDYVSEVIAAY